MEVEYLGNTYFIPKEPYETQEKLSKRAWYIAKHQPKTQEELLSLYRKSFLWYNVNTMGCQYEQVIMREVEEPKQKKQSARRYLRHSY